MMFLTLKNNNKNKKGGFTILETLVAITIILLAITGPMDIIEHSLKASYYSRDEVTAFYLAQEAIEYVRNQRDNNELNQATTINNWLTDAISNACLNDADTPEESKTKCILYQDSGGIYKYELCPGNSCLTDARTYALKKYDSGVFGWSGTPDGLTDTQFTREVYFTKVRNPYSADDVIGGTRNEVLMTVNIYWSNTFGTNNKFTLSTRLFNWKITNE